MMIPTCSGARWQHNARSVTIPQTFWPAVAWRAIKLKVSERLVDDVPPLLTMLAAHPDTTPSGHAIIVEAIPWAPKDYSGVGRAGSEFYAAIRPPSKALKTGDRVELKVRRSGRDAERPEEGTDCVVKGRVHGVRHLTERQVELVIKNEDRTAIVQRAFLRLGPAEQSWDAEALADGLRRRLEEIENGTRRARNGGQSAQHSIVQVGQLAKASEHYAFCSSYH